MKALLRSWKENLSEGYVPYRMGGQRREVNNRRCPYYTLSLLNWQAGAPGAKVLLDRDGGPYRLNCLHSPLVLLLIVVSIWIVEINGN
jgi:hypothetical protein